MNSFAKQALEKRLGDVENTLEGELDSMLYLAERVKKLMEERTNIRLALKEEE